MNFDIIQNTTDKTFILENASQSILDCNEQIKVLKEHYFRLRKPFPVHSSANFRDSLIHYEKLYATLLSVEGSCQKYAFDEHLQRCIKDACVLLANTYLEILTNILTSSTLNKKRDKNFLQQCEQIKNECKFIFDVSPELKNSLAYWTVNNLDKVCKGLSDDFFKSLKESANCNDQSKKFYLKYVMSCLLNYYKYNSFNWFQSHEIDEIRKLVHELNNHILGIRSESTDLVKSYQNKEKNSFWEFIEISNQIYNFMEKHFLTGLVFFGV